MTAADMIESVRDVAGKSIETGDTVVAVNGQTTGKVCEITREDDFGFVCVRPVHQAYGKGVWYAADQVFWVARPNTAKKDKKPAAKSPATPGKSATRGSKASPPARGVGPAKKK